MSSLENTVYGSVSPFRILSEPLQKTDFHRLSADSLVLGALSPALKGLNNGLYGNLPIELFKTERSFYAFDARNVCFSKIGRILYDVLTILRAIDADLPFLISSLPQHPAHKIQTAYEEVLRCQEDGLFTKYDFKRQPLHQNDETSEFCLNQWVVSRYLSRRSVILVVLTAYMVVSTINTRS